MITAFSEGNLATARVEQYRSVQLIELLRRFGYVAAAKAVMGMLGVDVGPVCFRTATSRRRSRAGPC
jgi:N-acetylneuraminate lyase